MGIYAVTGGSSGIGAKTVELLKQKGHEVLNIDLRGGNDLFFPVCQRTSGDF